jgi:hypothetical protein
MDAKENTKEWPCVIQLTSVFSGTVAKDKVVDTVTRLHVGLIQGSNPSRGKRSFSSPKSPGCLGSPSLLLDGCLCSFPGVQKL